MRTREQHLIARLFGGSKRSFNLCLGVVELSEILETNSSREVQSHEHCLGGRAFAGTQSFSVMRERVVVPAAPVARESHAMLDRRNRGQIICSSRLFSSHCP